MDNRGPVVEPFLRYKGLFYDVGTKLKFKAYIDTGYFCGIKEGVIDRFVNNHVILKTTEGETYSFCTTRNLVDFDKVIIEIIDPVYFTPGESKPINYNKPDPWDVEIGWIWYIIIMIVGAIFKGRITIWVFATAIFFLWKSGKLGKK